MSGNITPYGLRMPPDLRAKLQNKADLVGRSLNSEIVARLRESVDVTYTHAASPVMRDSADSSYQALSENEQAMLTLFRRWPSEKQLSFLVLFK